MIAIALYLCLLGATTGVALSLFAFVIPCTDSSNAGWLAALRQFWVGFALNEVSFLAFTLLASSTS